MKDFTTASNATTTAPVTAEAIKEAMRKFHEITAEMPEEMVVVVGDAELAWLREHVPPANPYMGFANPIPLGGIEVQHVPVPSMFFPIPKRVIDPPRIEFDWPELAP